MKKILIIGMGEFGKHLARNLANLNNEICIVDSHPEIINVLSDEFENAYVGDCMQPVTLKELGAGNFDICVVAIGSNFQASLEVTSRLKEIGAKYVISKASSEIQSKNLKHQFQKYYNLQIYEYNRISYPHYNEQQLFQLYLFQDILFHLLLPFLKT